MDSDLTARLEAVLSDPGQMEKLASMAKELMGQGGGGGGEAPASAAGKDMPDGKLLAALGKAFSGGERSRSADLLMAMRPYMKPEKQEKLDRAMKIARMVHVAEAVVRQYGGEDHGL